MLTKCRELAKLLRVELPNEALYSTIERTTLMKMTLLDLPGLVNLKNSLAKSTLTHTQPRVSFLTKNATWPTRRKSYRWKRGKVCEGEIALKDPRNTNHLLCSYGLTRLLTFLPKALTRYVQAEAWTLCDKANLSRYPFTRPKSKQPRERWTASRSTSPHWRVRLLPGRKHKGECRISWKQVACEGLPAHAAYLPTGAHIVGKISHAGGRNRTSYRAGCQRKARTLLFAGRYCHQGWEFLLCESKETNDQLQDPTKAHPLKDTVKASHSYLVNVISITIRGSIASAETGWIRFLRNEGWNWTKNIELRGNVHEDEWSCRLGKTEAQLDKREKEASLRAGRRHLGRTVIKGHQSSVAS